MDMFLKDHPEFKEKYSIINQIKTKTIEIPNISSHPFVVDVAVLKKLMKLKFFHSKELKQTFEKIIKKETKGIERMVFKLLAHQKIYFDDIGTKFMFYKAFPEHRKYFFNRFEDADSLINDSLYRAVNFSENEVKIPENISFDEKLFYLLALREYISSDTVKEIAKSLDTLHSDFNTPSIKILILSALPENEFIESIAFSLIYGSSIEKIQIIRVIGDYVEYNKVLKAMLKESFSTNTALSTVYISFLGTLELLPIPYADRIDILFSWLRFFLYTQSLKYFKDLLNEINNYSIDNPEISLFRQFNEYFANKNLGPVLLTKIKNFDDKNMYSLHSFDDIISQYIH